MISFFATQGKGSISGAFLASRFSTSLNDFDKSAKYTVDMIRKGKKQPEIYNDALLFSIAAGNFDEAHSLAAEMGTLGLKSPALGLTLIIGKIKERQFDEAIKLMLQFEQQLPFVLRTSIRGWISFQKGNLAAAVGEFSNFKNADLNLDLGSYYTAIAYAQTGNYSKSSEILRSNKESFQVLGKSYEIFRANVLNLANDNVNDELLSEDNIKASLNSLTLKQLLKKMKNGEVSTLDIFETPNSGIADTLLLFADGDSREVSQNLIEIFYCQLAHYLSDNEARFTIRLAQALAEGKLIEEAIDTLMLVDESDLFYLESKLMLADLLTESFREKLAIKELKDLINNGIQDFEVYESLGNAYRHSEQFKLATLAYSEALAVEDDRETVNQKLWLIYFFRGIAREQLKEYKESMADLRQALEYMPEQPQVLNYLGYMLIDRKEHLDEALEMIELAVKKSPQSGYIIDSLAWGLYQLGRYNEAITPMEQAIALEPEDPIVNDHFGDILWKVGRKREAYFQWKKALLFNPDEELILRIQQKLERGLEDLLGDEVAEEEINDQ